MTNPPVLTSRTIGMAENALRAVLIKVLAGTALDYHRFVALKAVIERSSPIAAAELVDQLKAGLKIDGATAAGVIEDLCERGIVRKADDHPSPTPEGASLYRRLNDEVRRLSQRIDAGLDVNDLIVAHRVLSAITERASALLAS